MTDNLDAIYKTIGRFAVTFSRLEQALGETLTALFKLADHPDRGVIIGAINFAGKVNILKQAAQNAILPDKTPATDEWKKNIVGTLNSVFDLNNKQRNVLMHSYLEPRDDGGLVLEKLGGGSQTWTIGAFENKLSRMEQLTADLKKLNDELTNAKIIVPTGVLAVGEASDRAPYVSWERLEEQPPWLKHPPFV